MRKIRFAFFASVWSFEDEDEQKGTLGQFCEELSADFPKGIRRMNVADPSAESSFVDVSMPFGARLRSIPSLSWCTFFTP